MKRRLLLLFLACCYSLSLLMAQSFALPPSKTGYYPLDAAQVRGLMQDELMPEDIVEKIKPFFRDESELRKGVF